MYIAYRSIASPSNAYILSLAWYPILRLKRGLEEPISMKFEWLASKFEDDFFPFETQMYIVCSAQECTSCFIFVHTLDFYFTCSFFMNTTNFHVLLLSTHSEKFATANLQLSKIHSMLPNFFWPRTVGKKPLLCGAKANVQRSKCALHLLLRRTCLYYFSAQSFFLYFS